MTGWILGYPAVKNKGFESAYVTTLGVLESVPVIGFFPLVLLFFIYKIGGALGVELAADFLVFDAVVWNIWVGIYQAFKTVPKEWVEVGENYGYSTPKLIRRIYVPFSVPRIAANLFPSVADGLFYLTVSEVISVGAHTYQTLGVGSLITRFLSTNDIVAVYVSLASLAVAVVAVTLSLRVFANWAVSRYTVDTDVPIVRRGRLRTRYSIIVARSLSMNTMARLSTYARRLTPRLGAPKTDEGHVSRGARFLRSLPRHKRIMVAVPGAVFIAFVAYSIVNLVAGVPRSTWLMLLDGTPYDLYGLLVDYARVTIITLASLGLAFTLGYLLAVRKTAEKIGLPIIQAFSSFPAPAYFPLLFVFTYPLAASIMHGFADEFYVLLLGWLSTFYYVLYSFWMGVKALPSEYWEVSRNLDMGFLSRMRRVVIPATLPYLVSGLASTVNSAWGGLEIGEYWNDIYGSRNLGVHTGLIRALDLATAQGNLTVAGWLSFLFAVVVVAYSLLFTKRLMDLSRKKYVAEEGIYAA